MMDVKLVKHMKLVQGVPLVIKVNIYSINSVWMYVLNIISLIQGFVKHVILLVLLAHKLINVTHVNPHTIV
jgi:hypothetical protein